MRRHRQRGFGLIDALIALAMLAFGMLAMTKLQARAIAQGTESTSRLTATQLADELLSNVLVDNVNYGCYTLPAGTCGSATAKTRTEDWKNRVLAALPAASAASTYDGSTNQMKVTITWSGKESGSERTVKVSTDVR